MASVVICKLVKCVHAVKFNPKTCIKMCAVKVWAGNNPHGEIAKCHSYKRRKKYARDIILDRGLHLQDGGSVIISNFNWKGEMRWKDL